MRTGARIGAAAFALGLALAGPQAVAFADGAGDDSPAESPAGAPAESPAESSAGRQDTTRQAAAGPARRSAPASGARTGRPARPAAAADNAPRTQRPISEAKRVSPARGPKSVGDLLTRDPGAAATFSPPAVSYAPATAAAAAVAPRTAAPAATVNDVPGPDTGSEAQNCGACKAFDASDVPFAGPALTAVVRTTKLIDGLGNLLSALPAGPAADFLSGALLLLRRNVFPEVSTVPEVSIQDVVLDEGSNQVVFTVTLDKAYTSTVTVGYVTDALADRAVERKDLAARATAGVDYHAVSGILTFTSGETSQQITITVLDDMITEISETFGLQIVATAADKLTPVRLASAIATIVDDDRTRIDVNPNFAYGDALLAGIFSDLAYNHRNAADFAGRVQATGWEGIGIAEAGLGANGYSPASGGYGVKDGLTMQSYAFAGKRTAADGTAQFVVAFEGSNLPWEEPADWIVNAGEYGWSRYYASLEPLMSEVVGQMLQAQQDQQKTQLIITGHSLGGAAAMMAFADLLAPQGNLWPNTSDVLSAGRRVLDTVGGWAPETRTALLAATSVYTFGAPSILIEPTKPGTAEAVAFAALAAGSGFLAALGLLPAAVGTLTVDDKKLPNLTGIAGINFGTRVFQFEHANTSWWPFYPGDIVAQIGNRDPGTVLEVNLDNGVHEAYTSLLTRYVPGGTHPMTGYQESVTRLVTNSRLLKDPNKLAATSPKLPQTGAGNGSDTRNDFFVNVSDDGKNGNDVFVYSRAGSYSASGAQGSDAYSVTSYGVSLVIDGTTQSGRDTLVFDLAGNRSVNYSGDTAVFSVTGTGGQSSTVTITGWDQWQVSDVFQVIKPADGRWAVDAWSGIERPAVAVPPANEIPLSVL